MMKEQCYHRRVGKKENIFTEQLKVGLENNQNGNSATAEEYIFSASAKIDRSNCSKQCNNCLSPHSGDLVRYFLKPAAA
jgi:hypothetical protein